MTRLIYDYEKTEHRSVSIYKEPLHRHNVYEKKKTQTTKQTNKQTRTRLWKSDDSR